MIVVCSAERAAAASTEWLVSTTLSFLLTTWTTLVSFLFSLSLYLRSVDALVVVALLLLTFHVVSKRGMCGCSSLPASLWVRGRLTFVLARSGENWSSSVMASPLSPLVGRSLIRSVSRCVWQDLALVFVCAGRVSQGICASCLGLLGVG